MFMDGIFSWLGKELSALWAAVQPEAMAVFKTFVSTFEGAALAAVQAQVAADISGAQKFSNAGDQLTTIVKNAGWTASTTAINTLIQDAYTTYKASQGQTLVTPPAGG